jgi:hypothetical protein
MRSHALRSLVFVMCLASAGACAQSDDVRLAPEFTSRATADWINSPPLKIAAFQGKVVLLEVWTFDCWNCQRSLPWLKSAAERLGPKGLRLVGVHTPEFPRERVLENVQAQVRDRGIAWPVMIDNDGAYWKALGNQFWPQFYVIDKRGLIRASLAGETHDGDFNARAIEGLIGELLAEPG